MTYPHDNFNAPWNLRFEKDGTEDVAVLSDANGEELLRSRHFWLPQADDPVPPTLAAMRLIVAAPELLEALKLCWQQLSLWVADTESCDLSPEDDEALAKACDAIAQAEAAGITLAPPEPDIDALLAKRRQIAHIWSIEDVQGIRPDLTEEQCWEVLQHVDHYKDAELGITWLTLEMAAEHLCGDAPKDAAEGE